MGGCGGALRFPRRPFLLSFYQSFFFCLEIELGAEEGGNTQLGFLYPLTQVMVLHTGDCMGAKYWGCIQGQSLWRGGLIPAHCSLSVDKADSCN